MTTTKSKESKAVGLMGALLEAEKHYDQIKFDSESPGRVGARFKWASLKELYRATKPALEAQEIKCIGDFYVDASGNTIAQLTLYHIPSGESKSASLKMETAGQNEQKIGAMITYFRRYLYQSLLGIVAEEERDGEDLPEGNEQKSAKTKPLPSGTAFPEVDKAKVKALLDQLEKLPHIQKMLDDGLRMAKIPNPYYMKEGTYNAFCNLVTNAKGATA